MGRIKSRVSAETNKNIVTCNLSTPDEQMHKKMKQSFLDDPKPLALSHLQKTLGGKE